MKNSSLYVTQRARDLFHETALKNVSSHTSLIIPVLLAQPGLRLPYVPLNRAPEELVIWRLHFIIIIIK